MRLVPGIVLLMAGVAWADEGTAPIKSLDPLQPQGWRRAAEYSAAHRGVSVLVQVRGKVVFEDYPDGRDEAHELASGTKSFSGAMAVALVQDGKLSSLDEKVSDTITEWQKDPRKARVTVRQLLSLTSGLDGGTVGRVPSYRDAIDGDLNATPGFDYGPAPFQVFGELVKRKLGRSPLDYLDERILKPIGCTHARWRDRGGDPTLPSGASLTARSWVRFGELMRNGGVHEGKKLLDPALVDELFVGTKANPCYGVTFWLNREIDDATRARIPMLRRSTDVARGKPGLPDDLVFAAGAGDQRLYISRSLELVVVRQAKLGLRGGDFSDSEFLRLLLEK